MGYCKPCVASGPGSFWGVLRFGVRCPRKCEFSLSDAYCKTVVPPAEGRKDIVDARCVGLVLRVTRSGAKSWAFRFRDLVSRRSSRATLGVYPDIGLAKARELADDMRRSVAAGVNPVEQKRRARNDSDKRTFQALADRYLIEHARRHKRERSADEDEQILRSTSCRNGRSATIEPSAAPTRSN